MRIGKDKVFSAAGAMLEAILLGYSGVILLAWSHIGWLFTELHWESRITHHSSHQGKGRGENLGMGHPIRFLYHNNGGMRSKALLPSNIFPATT